MSADSEIREILRQRIDVDRQSVGIVVGVIEPAGRRIIAYGSYASGDPRPLDGTTLFEIGSITKVFTSLLLADMVRRGAVALDDRVANFLPEHTRVPTRGGRAIKLVDLATHSSGLPRMPANFAPKDPANPYADYSLERLTDFLAAYTLTRDIGAQYEYSNLGAALLGLALASRAGVDYESLVRSRITGPLGMASTRITLSADLQARLTPGHDATLKPVPNWDFTAFAAAGALKSSGDDLLDFLAANLGYTHTPLAAAMADMLKVRRPIPGSDLEIALGWQILKRPGGEIVWHNGETGGYHSFIGYAAKARTGVVVLSNGQPGIEDIGAHLLDTSIPLIKYHKQIAVDPKLFDGYVGRYEMTPDFILTVTREGDHLFVQASRQARLEVFAEGERDYFYRVVDAQITFETDGQGQAVRLILHQNGRDMQARRIE